MNSESVLQILADLGALINNSHIVYTSGRHGTAYINKDALYKHTQKTSELCKAMASNYQADEVDVVIGPTVGGVVLSQWVAHHLNTMRTQGETLALFAESEGEGQEKKFVIKRGYDAFIPGKNVVVVEDVLTTGGSARKVIECVQALDGKVLGLSVLCNKGVKPAAVCNVPIHSLITVVLGSWSEEECELCKKGIPINTNVGKGRVFLERRNVSPMESGEAIITKSHGRARHKTIH
jgi:orotate phosphoribosyltransferase